MKKTILATVCSITLLSGCQVFERPEKVRIPVPVACIEKKKIPPAVPRAENKLSRDDDPGTKIAVILTERERLRYSDTQFRALIKGCVLNW